MNLFGSAGAERSVYSTVRISLAYMTLLGAAYLFIPHLFLVPYGAAQNGAQLREIEEIARVLLRFVAIYTLFDALNITFSSAIKGAGDTRFVMVTIIVGSLGLLALPTYLLVMVFHAGIYEAWIIATVYICLLGIVFFVRFRRGKWKSMRVIEEPASPPVA